MNWPLMRRSHYKRAVTQAAQAYRWERDQALARAASAEKARDDALARLVKARALRDGYPQRLRVVLDCDDLLVHYTPTDDEYRRLAERIVLSLAGLRRDYRGDLRQTDTQRALGL